MEITLSLPDWVQPELDKLPTHFATVEERMAQVIHFSRLNFMYKTGGPFAAGIFERDSGKLITMGVNRVVPSSCSSAHAEIMALSVAQKKLGTFDLGGEGQPAHQIVINGQPCAMCFGAIPWSGVRSVVTAAHGYEVEALTGFDEGPVHPNWIHELEKRDIEVITDVLRKEACNALAAFGRSGQIVYNGRLG